MSFSITLRPDQRNTLLRHYRHAARPEWRLRAHVLLLLADGWAWATIACLLYTSSSTIARWQQRFLRGGLAAVFDAGPPRRCSPWLAVVVRWVLELAPAEFGFAGLGGLGILIVLVTEKGRLFQSGAGPHEPSRI